MGRNLGNAGGSAQSPGPLDALCRGLLRQADTGSVTRCAGTGLTVLQVLTNTPYGRLAAVSSPVHRLPQSAVNQQRTREAGMEHEVSRDHRRIGRAGRRREFAAIACHRCRRGERGRREPGGCPAVDGTAGGARDDRRSTGSGWFGERPRRPAHRCRLQHPTHRMETGWSPSTGSAARTAGLAHSPRRARAATGSRTPLTGSSWARRAVPGRSRREPRPPIRPTSDERPVPRPGVHGLLAGAALERGHRPTGL